MNAKMMAVLALSAVLCGTLFCGCRLLAAGESAPVKEIVKLLDAKVGEEAVKAYVSSRAMTLCLSADEIVALKKAGASDGLIVLLLGAGGGAGQVRIGEGGFPFDLDAEHVVDAPVVHGPVAIYSVRRKTPSEIGAFLTIDEAQARGCVSIREKGEGSVPVVVIVNRGNLPIYISAGEIIIGGKQDRMVAYDVIVHPGRELDIEVRCVERGRWHGGDRSFRSAGEIGSRKAKIAVQLDDQGTVWEQVARDNAACNVAPNSGTFMAGASSEEAKRRYEEYSRALLPCLDARDVVGFVVAVNGEVMAVEIFGSPGIFSKLKAKLLKSYVYDTIGVEDRRAPAPDRDAIVSFRSSIMKEREEEMKAYDRNRNIKRENSDASQTQCLDAESRNVRNSLIKK